MHSVQLQSSNNQVQAKSVKIIASNSTAIPFDRWPLWAKSLSLLKTDADKGIGDTIERLIGPMNSAKFKEWYKLTFGKACGCNARKDKWNKEYPFFNQ